MDPAEVLGIEIQQYVGEGLKTLVPRIVGSIATLQKPGGSRARRKWDEESFLAEIAKSVESAELDLIRRILHWASERGYAVSWGEGATDGSFTVSLIHSGMRYPLFVIWTSGALNVYFDALKNKPPLADGAPLVRLLDKLNLIAGLRLPPEAASKYTRVELSNISAPDHLASFLQAFDELAQEVRGSPAQ